MGPSLGRLGDCAASIAPGGRRCRNGAEPRKARRPCNNSSQAARKSSRRNGAEPRKARRLADPEENPRPSVAPQWGRASEGSETRRRRGSILRRRWRRNGAEPRKARRPAAPYSGSEQLASPQWGRASEGSETAHARLGAHPRAVGAAMGPSLGRLGDIPMGTPEYESTPEPQWGRASEGSETPHRPLWKLQRQISAAMGPSLGRLGD